MPITLILRVVGPPVPKLQILLLCMKNMPLSKTQVCYYLGNSHFWFSIFLKLNDAVQYHLGKAQVAKDTLGFEMMKYERQVQNNGKGVELEEKKFNHSIILDKKKWDHGIKLEEKKWEHGIKWEEKWLEWEKEEKDRDQSFEMAKLDCLASQDHTGKKYDFLTQCVLNGKSTEEIEQLANLFK